MLSPCVPCNATNMFPQCVPSMDSVGPRRFRGACACGKKMRLPMAPHKFQPTTRLRNQKQRANELTTQPPTHYLPPRRIPVTVPNKPSTTGSSQLKLDCCAGNSRRIVCGTLLSSCVAMGSVRHKRCQVKLGPEAPTKKRIVLGNAATTMQCRIKRTGQSEPPQKHKIRT